MKAKLIALFAAIFLIAAITMVSAANPLSLMSKSFSKSISSVPVCGNHIPESGEQCDDGNTINGDGCSSTCQSENLLCFDYVYTGQDTNGLSFGKHISTTLDHSNSQYTVIADINNTQNSDKTIDYEWFACRCQTNAGTPDPFCLGYWPSVNYTGSLNYTGDPSLIPGNCISYGKKNITLPASSLTNFTANISQFRNQVCGKYQLDMFVYDVNGVSTNQLLAIAPLAGLCLDCPNPSCGDGIVDAGEQCDLGNLNGPNSECSLTCENNTPSVPEFGLIAGMATVAGAIGLFFFIRRK